VGQLEQGRAEVQQEARLFPEEVGGRFVEIVTYGQAQVVPPFVEDDLRPVDDLRGEDPLSGFLYADREIRHLSTASSQLRNGRVRNVEAQRVAFNRVRLESLWIERCLLASAEWDECDLSRVVFRNCKILGGRFTGNRWASVVFDGCRIDYVTFESVRTSAPVVFTNTRLNDVTFADCVFPGGHMSGCELQAVTFAGGRYEEFDLRGNDLSTIRGAANLDGAVIAPAQRPELAEAFVAELDLRYLDGV